MLPRQPEQQTREIDEKVPARHADYKSRWLAAVLFGYWCGWS
jgi:hypothetical protein